jgi:DNA-binding GntR family transcriptional regulator
MAFRALPIRYSANMSQEYLDDVRDDHLGIIRALADGDRARLVALIKRHNRRGLAWYRKQRA